MKSASSHSRAIQAASFRQGIGSKSLAVWRGEAPLPADTSDFAIYIRLAGEPQGKARPRFMRKTGHTYTPEKTRNYETCLRLAAQDVMGMMLPLEGPVDVYMLASFSVPASWSAKKRAAALSDAERPTKKPDCDNIAKAIDALNGIVFRDDSQVVQQTVVKRYSDKPGLLIEVRPSASIVTREAA